MFIEDGPLSLLASLIGWALVEGGWCSFSPSFFLVVPFGGQCILLAYFQITLLVPPFNIYSSLPIYKNQKKKGNETVTKGPNVNVNMWKSKIAPYQQKQYFLSFSCKRHI